MGFIKKIIYKFQNSNHNKTEQIPCKAPYSSLYFSVDGKMSMCCYNRIDTFGTYPENSIKEAWFGTKRKDILNKVIRNEYPKLCQLCFNRKQENVFQTKMTQIFDNHDIKYKYPYEISFECSNICNLNCIMCFNNLPNNIGEQKNEKLPKGEVIYDDFFIEELKEFIPHIKIAKFLGGEPFLIPVYYKIWDEIIRLNPQCKMMITTNGTVLNERIKKLLNLGNFHICVSIDSLEKSNFEKIRHNAEYEIAINNLKYFIDFCKAKDRNIVITTCFMQHNYKDIPDIIKFCNNNEIEFYFNQVWFPSNAALWNSNSTLLNAIFSIYSDIKLPDNTVVQKKNLASFNELIGFLKIWYTHSIEKEKQSTKYQTADIPYLKGILYEKLTSYFNEQSQENTMTLVKNEIERIFKSQNDQEKLCKMIIYYINTPPELIYSCFVSNILYLLY